MVTWLLLVALASTTWAAPPSFLQGFTAMNTTVPSKTLQTKPTLHMLQKLQTFQTKKISLRILNIANITPR